MKLKFLPVKLPGSKFSLCGVNLLKNEIKVLQVDIPLGTTGTDHEGQAKYLESKSIQTVKSKTK
jgi:hypothetical protein